MNGGQEAAADELTETQTEVRHASLRSHLSLTAAQRQH